MPQKLGLKKLLGCFVAGFCMLLLLLLLLLLRLLSILS